MAMENGSFEDVYFLLNMTENGDIPATYDRLP